MRNKIMVLGAFALLFGTTSFAANNLKQYSRHYMDVWGGFGYSSLLHNIESTSVPGSVGAQLGMGYEWRYKKFLLTTGAEFSFLNATTKVDDFNLNATLLYNDPYHTAYAMDYKFAFTDYRESHHVGLLNIPIMAGAKFGRYYFLAGGKMGLGLLGRSQTTSTLTTTLKDPALIGDFSDMENHNLTSGELTASDKFTCYPDIQASAEFGVYLDEWFPKQALALKNKRKTPLSYRLAVFCDYGVNSLIKTAEDAPQLAQVDVTAPRYIATRSLFDSNRAIGQNVNSLLVGVKFAVQFQVSKEPQKKPKTLPNPLLIIKTYDEESGKSLNATFITAYNNTARRNVIINKPASQGILAQRVPKGNYTVSATQKDYDKAVSDIALQQLGDTVEMVLRLKHKPVFRGVVLNGETNRGMSAQITFSGKRADGVAFNAKVTSDSISGAFKTMLPSGTYNLTVQQFGYEDYTSTVSSLGDSVTIWLQALKKGKKVVLHNLFFATNSTTILPESEAGLDEIYKFLSENQKVRIKIVGHTDNVGTEAHNKQLSEGRAKSVRQSMIERGIEPSRIEYEGRGPKEPVSTNDTEEGRALNRRVEFEIL